MANYILQVTHKIIIGSLYLILWISCLFNIVNSICTEGTDHLYHKVCYPNGPMTATKLTGYYNTTFTNFIPIQNHTYTSSTSAIDCDTISNPSSVPNSGQGNTKCYACCITTIESEENSVTLDDEYTKWRLLFQINENLFDFLDDLIFYG
eukprot:175125_1